MDERDIAMLQGVLDQSVAGASPWMRESFEMPDHTLKASQLVRYFAQVRDAALATVTPRGEPRVAPLGVLLSDGRFYVPTVAHASRVRHIATNPAVSLTHSINNAIAVIAHGSAKVVPDSTDEFARVDRLNPQARWWRDVQARGIGIYLRIDATHIYAWAARVADYPT